MVITNLLLAVAVLLGGAFVVTSWRINRLATRRWTTLQRHLDGAIAGVGMLVAAPVGAFMAAWGLGHPLIALGRRLGWLTPSGPVPGHGELLVVLAVALLGAAGVSAAIGYACVRPGRRGVLCGLGVLAFAGTTGAATGCSPLSEVDPALRWVSVLLATGAACALGGAALLASESERPEEPEAGPSL